LIIAVIDFAVATFLPNPSLVQWLAHYAKFITAIALLIKRNGFVVTTVLINS